VEETCGRAVVAVREGGRKSAPRRCAVRARPPWLQLALARGRRETWQGVPRISTTLHDLARSTKCSARPAILRPTITLAAKVVVVVVSPGWLPGRAGALTAAPRLLQSSSARWPRKSPGWPPGRADALTTLRSAVVSVRWPNSKPGFGSPAGQAPSPAALLKQDAVLWWPLLCTFDPLDGRFAPRLANASGSKPKTLPPLRASRRRSRSSSSSGPS